MRESAFSIIVSLIIFVFSASVSDASAASPPIQSSVDTGSLAEKKQTSLGLYLTAKEVHTLLLRRDDVVLVDVRTPEETMFVGFPEGAAVNAPYKLVDPAYEFSAKKGGYALMMNPDFVERVRAFLKTLNANKVNTLVLMCRSGGRSAGAVDALAKAGFTNVYSMIDGFEGDKDEDGKRTVNGWKNAGAPWSTNVRKDYWFRN